MAISRYENLIPLTKDGKMFRPSSSVGRRIKQAVDANKLSVRVFTLAAGQRLDLVSANYYGTPSYWWVIAAASGIGWQCQVPPGTVLKIPISIEKVISLAGY